MIGCEMYVEEEGWVIVISGDDGSVPKGRGWRTLTYSWLMM
jgi:hypothetical protein